MKSALIAAIHLLSCVWCLDGGEVRERKAQSLRHVGILPGIPGNHNPSFTRGPDVTVIEDTGIYLHGTPWATDICDGEGASIFDPNLGMTTPHASRCPNSGTQTVRFTIVCDRPSLFNTQPALTECSSATCNCPPTVPTNNANCGGLLSFVTAPNQCGTTLCSVRLDDGGEDQCVEDPAHTSCSCPGCCNGLDCQFSNAMLAACPTAMPSPTPFLCPAGCQPADCSVSITHQFSITVTCVNDQPAFDCLGSGATSGANAAFKGDTTVEINDFIFNIRTCLDCALNGQQNNENLQKPRFVISNTNPSLFNVQPQIVWDPNDPATADLRYDPKSCEVGTATVTVRMFDDGGVNDGGVDVAPVDCVFQIEIRDKNTAPSFDFGTCPLVIDEDHGPYTANAWAGRRSKGCTSGSGEENQQDLTFNVQLVNAADAGLFTTQPTIDPMTGTLTFTPRTDINTFGRNVDMYVQLCDDGVLKTNPPPASPLCTCDPITNCPTCKIVIRPVNDAPSFTPGEDVLVWEDLCQLAVPPDPLTFTVPDWAKDINVGAASEGLTSPNPMVFNPEGQRLYFVVTTDNDGIFAAGGGPVIDETGTLSFTLARDANGISNVRATLYDTGDMPNEGNTAVFKITALPVNDKPTFDLDPKGAPGPLVVSEGASALEFDSWLSRVSKGPDDEAAQKLTLRTTVSNPDCFLIQPNHDFTSTTSVRLSFQPATNVPSGANCESDVTVFVKDDGLDLRCNMFVGGCDCGDEREVTYKIRVTDTNDPPSFTIGPDVTIQEDAFPGGYTAIVWAKDVSAGPNEGPPLPQTVLFHVSTSNDALFAQGKGPAVGTDGTLTFTAAPDACGTATVSVYLEDNGVPPLQSAAQQSVITISCCNDPPEFTISSDIVGTALPECTTACARQFPNFLTSIRPGPTTATDEATQTVRFYLSGFDASLFEGTDGQPKIDQFGTLTVTPKMGVNTPSPFTVTIRAEDDSPMQAGCSGSATKTFQMQITPWNNAPSFIHSGNVEVLEDSGTASFPQWARSISAGPGDESTQTLTFTVRAADPSLFDVQPTVSPQTGLLSFRPAPDAFGTTEVTVTLDDGQALNSQQAQTIIINIVPVNDRPSFTAPSEINILEDRPTYTEQFAVSVSKGAPNEAAQTLSYKVTGLTNADLFQSPPVVSPDGILTFTTAKDKWGESKFTVHSVDNGGTAHLGEDTSLPVTVTLKVASVNDAPTFKIRNDITGVLEDSGMQSYTNWVWDVTPGAPDELSQVVTFTLTPDKPAMFSQGPTVDQYGTLTFTPALDAFGTTTVSILASDSGPGTGDGKGGGPPDMRSSEFVFFTITIVGVNDAPKVVLGTPPVVLEDSVPTALVDWARQVSAGADNEAEQSLTWRIIPSDPTLFKEQPVMVQQQVTMCSGGCTADLQFTVAADANGVTQATVCLQDNGGTLHNGVDVACSETTITVTAVDDPPIVTVDTTVVTVLEDSGTTVLDNWLRNVVPGPRDEWNQQITSVSVEAALGQQDTLATLLESTPKLERWPSGPLSVTTRPDSFGEVELEVVAVDTGIAGRNTGRLPFTIKVLAVNDKPSFVSGGSVSHSEGGTPYSNPWASNVQAGPPNEVTQSLTFSITVGDPSLFTAQPSVDPTSGILTFTAASGVYGTTRAVAVLRDNGGGQDTSDEAVFNITIVAKNDRPVWFKGTDVMVMEDSGPYAARFATNISAGVNEGHQGLTFEVTMDPGDILTNAPVIDVQTGWLSFTPNLNRHGTVVVNAILMDNGGTTNGGMSSSLQQTFTITVRPVNDRPSVVPGADVVVLEDAPPQEVANWVVATSPGPFEDGQTVSFFLTANREALFTQQPAASSVTKALSFTPKANLNGDSSVSLVARDSGGTANGGRDTSEAVTFKISITPVNDAPVWTVGVNVQLNEDDPPVVIPKWTDGKPGPADAVDEEAQTLIYLASTNNPTLFSTPPVVSPVGDLSFTAAPNANGVATIDVVLTDNGGTLNGGVDRAPLQSFTIEVRAVEDPPTFTAGARVIRVEPGQTHNSRWATAITGGPLDESQVVRFTVVNNNAGLFSVVPSVSSVGDLTFTAGSGIGSAEVSVVAYDQGNLASVAEVFQIIVGTDATAVRSVVRTTDTVLTFDRIAYGNAVCALLSVPSERCVVTDVTTDPSGGLQVQVDFQPGVNPTAQQLAQQFLQLDTSSLSITRSWPVPSLSVPGPTGLTCSAVTVITLCVAPCVWDPQRNICTSVIQNSSDDSSLSTLHILLILLACFAVVLMLAGLAYALLTKRKEKQRQQEQEAAELQERNKEASPVVEQVPHSQAPSNPLDTLYAPEPRPSMG
eukprot:TRINITY_DN891_c4_g1_i1.p1 TRINITY_DN891_c4_g1~~TRINITY_DN891_c4_g1_i1.p1  ORF type:complete len:2318 (+),score=489.01 TRINITY_DN891_c4_g1_i1:139-7092(+)